MFEWIHTRLPAHGMPLPSRIQVLTSRREAPTSTRGSR